MSLVESDPIQPEQWTEQVARCPGESYAILDACDEPKVPILAKNLGERAVSLYRGRADEEYWAIAPYLVRVDQKVLGWIFEELGGTSYGIFVSAATNLESLRKHFRRFLMVKSPEGKSLYFRYYDPRVLPTFLCTANSEEVDSFFGPVSQFVVPMEENGLAVFRRLTSVSPAATRSPN